MWVVRGTRYSAWSTQAQVAKGKVLNLLELKRPKVSGILFQGFVFHRGNEERQTSM